MHLNSQVGGQPLIGCLSLLINVPAATLHIYRPSNPYATRGGASPWWHKHRQRRNTWKQGQWGATCVKFPRITGMNSSEYNVHPNFFEVYGGKKSANNKLTFRLKKPNSYHNQMFSNIYYCRNIFKHSMRSNKCHTNDVCDFAYRLW